MTADSTDTTENAAPARGSFADALSVYLKRRVLIIGLLGFSGGLPIVLVGATLQAWMKLDGIDVKIIGLAAAVALPYNLKVFWSPLVDAVDIPVLSRLLGRRRGWLLFSQIFLIATIVCLGLCDPAVSVPLVMTGAVLVATASATQDIVIDAFRVESLSESEQAAGMASYVAAYRIGSLVAGAGSLLLVAELETHGVTGKAAWTACYVVMAALVLIGVVATMLAKEPESSTAIEAGHGQPTAKSALERALWSAVDSLRDFLSRNLAIGALAFVVLFKLADALAFALLTPFVLDLGFSLTQVATIRNGVGFIAALLGGFVGGFIARALPLSTSLWIGGILQAIMVLAFSWQAVVGHNLSLLAVTTTIESFSDAVGTVIFVAYLSALCRNPLYTATQFALLTALAALGRNVFSLGTGYIQHATGWPWYFVVCVLAGLPGLALLAWLQRHGHFERLMQENT
jgi:MFS transporter, PAT family, beta-lactamase induction signal transducer AmpG